MPTVSKNIPSAVQILAQGDIVAMPTETVYGLAGRIDFPQALEKIFRVKQRPFFDPLIVHVESKKQAMTLTSEWNEMTELLADKFWPGPLTMVLPKAARVNSMITSGLESVGIRCPRHPMALALLKQAGVPLAAPSANRFGRTSPTTPLHVAQEFPTENLLILDGGPCEVGIESTVLKIEKTKNGQYSLFILRKGLLTQKLLEEVLQNSSLRYQFLETTNATSSPGHLEHHYMPPIPLIYCSIPTQTPAKLFERLKASQQLDSSLKRMGVLKLASDAALAARQLYNELRKLSGENYDALVFYQEDWQTSEAWAAVLDRIYRASKIKVLT
jgi:L-threonylcarbamoyladenylate synthase